MKDINAAYKKLERLENDEADSDDEDDMFDDDDDIFGFMSMMCAPAAALQLNQAAVSPPRLRSTRTARTCAWPASVCLRFNSTCAPSAAGCSAPSPDAWHCMQL